jgi:hypothetical protein
MEADAEVPATHQQLQDLIQREAKKSPTSASSKRLPHYVKRRWEKTIRGATPPRAPHNKKRKYKIQNGKKGRRG